MFCISVSVLTPVPGSRLRERLLRENRIININDWRRYSFNEVNIIPRNMTPQQLKVGFLSIQKRIYSDEVNIKRMKYFKNIFKKTIAKI